MRIAFFSFSEVPFGSNDLLYFRAAEKALQKGHDVLFSPFDWESENALEYRRVAEQGAAVQFRSRHIRHNNFFLRQIQKLRAKVSNPYKELEFIKRFNPHVIVISDASTYHMLGEPSFAEYIQNLGIPFITISQYNNEISSFEDAKFDLARRFFGAAEYWVFVSNRNLNVARLQLCLPLNHGVVLDNPPNLESLEREPFPMSKEACMAMVARLNCGVKGQSIVLDILARPPWNSRDWRLNIYGNGPDERYLRELINFLQLQEKVFLRGHVRNVREVWAENEILLMCSTGEGKPLAITEAMICGRPAIVTDVGGNAELIEEKVTGFVAESATVKSFAQAMDRAWERRSQWEEMGERAHAKMSARLTSPPEQQLLNLIESIRNPKVEPVQNPKVIEACAA